MKLPDYWKSLLWTAFIFTVILIPGDKIPKNRLFYIAHFDKWVHLALFAILEFLVLFEGKARNRFWKIFFFSALYGFFLAVLSELLQKLPHLNRQASLYDLLADAMGLVLGALAFRYVSKFKFLSFLER